MPPTKTKSRRRLSPSSPGEPRIAPQVEDRQWMAFDRQMTAIEVKDLLERALVDGDLGAQGRLFWGMVDTWPDLASALDKMFEGVCHAGLEFRPAENGEDKPTDEAVRICDLVKKAWRGMRDIPERLLVGEEGTISNIATGYYYGHSVSEIVWERKLLDGVDVWAPASTLHLDPQFYGYPSGLIHGAPERLVLRPDGDQNPNNERDFPGHEHLISVRRNHPGHPAHAAPMRSLVGYWLAFSWGLKWLMQNAQLFGVPIRWAKYQGDNVKCEVERFLQGIGSSGYAAVPQGVDLEIHSVSSSAANLPQAVLIEMANKAVSIFISGETLTTDVQDSGSRALGDVHQTTGHRRLCSVVNHVRRVINDQFLPAFAFWNDIDPELLPTFGIPDEHESEQDAKAKAERLAIVVNQVGVPVPEAWLHEQLGVPVPESEAETFKPIAQTIAEAAENEPGKPGEKKDDEEKKPAAVDSARSVEEADEALDALAATVAQSVLGVEKRWLAPVIPIFQDLIKKAQDSSVSEENFREAVEAVAEALPTWELDADAYAKEMEKALATAMVSGGAASI